MFNKKTVWQNILNVILSAIILATIINVINNLSMLIRGDYYSPSRLSNYYLNHLIDNILSIVITIFFLFMTNRFVRKSEKSYVLLLDVVCIITLVFGLSVLLFEIRTVITKGVFNKYIITDILNISPFIVIPSIVWLLFVSKYVVKK